MFAVCATGVEDLMVAELRSLGIAVGGTPGNQTIVPGVEPGGVAFSGSLESLYSANLHLRTASRVLVRVGEFRARALGELERRAKEQPWERFIQPGREVRLRVTCRKSRLYHSGAVAARVANAIQARVGGAAAIAPASGDDEGDDHDDAQLIVVRMLHDQCTLSVDASGALLHRRGYRLATAKAPLRETL
ncbi:MAG TPA: THUMP domain-containing protein, partial [Gemmatimonadaceae bacterium]